MYRRIIAEQAIKARAMANQSDDKPKYEYDSDEDIEGGTWEHKKRKKEMDKTFGKLFRAFKVLFKLVLFT